MFPEQVEIDVPALEAIGAEINSAAVTLEDANAAAGDNLVPGGQAGWDGAVAARDAARTGGAYLTDLAAGIKGLGQDFTTAARQYDAADQASGADIRGGWTQVPR